MENIKNGRCPTFKYALSCYSAKLSAGTILSSPSLSLHQYCLFNDTLNIPAYISYITKWCLWSGGGLRTCLELCRATLAIWGCTALLLVERIDCATTAHMPKTSSISSSLCWIYCANVLRMDSTNLSFAKNILRVHIYRFPGRDYLLACEK
jgi:hypothetical protein